jgi:hypothetical protein
MPIYMEERDLRPVPGAFGITMRREEWERLNRPDRDFLDGTGPYKNHLRIHIDEEYGYKEWLWTYPGTVRELVEDWKAGYRPVFGRHSWNWSWKWSSELERKGFRGELDEITWKEYSLPSPGLQTGVLRSLPSRRQRSEHPIIVETGQPVTFLTDIDSFHGEAHIHQEDDSWLKVSYYELYGLREVKEIIHVLDALASL